ncbi:MAG: methyltransferase domain-containing protein [Pyrinomonadaceae bacterium]
MAVPPDNSKNKLLRSSSHLTGEGVVVDIGTGDGLFVYNSARQNPQKFYIGIDANRSPLRKISEKIHRKPAKGGLPNVLFLEGAVEELPEELNQVADEVHIHLPWGSLLRAVATGDKSVLKDVRRICAPDALLEVVIGSDSEKDRFEFERLGLQLWSGENLNSTVISNYKDSGFEIFEHGLLAPSEWPNLHTSWAKRLSGSATRSLFYFIARAV